MAFDAIGTEAKYSGSQFFLFCLLIAEGTRFSSTAGGIVFGIEVEDDRAPQLISQTNLVAIVGV